MPANKVADGSKVKYVYVEVIHSQNNKHDTVGGLFKGLIEKNGHTFILLSGLNSNITNCLNLKFYGIMMIETLQDDFKSMVFCTAEKVDQDIAFEMIQSLYKELVDAGRILQNDGHIIDDATYEDVPEEYRKGKAVERSSTASNSGVGSFANNTTRYTNQGGTYARTVVRKDPEPTLFKRSKGKKPTKDNLDILQSKLNQILEGTYQAPIPEADTAEAFDGGNDDDIAIYNVYGY